MLFLLVVAFLLSCGGEGEGRGPEIKLSFMGLVNSPYFTAVEVRISGEEFEPITLRKTGIFFPGDVVEFSVFIPEGPERLFEATVYDNLGNPVYYGAKTVDVDPESRIIIELYPSEVKVNSFMRFLDSDIPTDIDFFVVNEELYTGYGPERITEGSLKTYMTGSYVAFLEKSKFVKYIYSYAAPEVFLSIEDVRNFTLELPQGEVFLYLTGSYEGIVYGNETISILTGNMLSDGSLILSGVGEGIHFFSGVPEGDVVSFQHSTCLTLTEPDCIPLGLKFSGFVPERIEVYGVYKGIEFLVSNKNHFWHSSDLKYKLKVYGNFGTQGCSYSWSLEKELPEDFSGVGEFVINTVTISVPEGIKGSFKVYGKGLEVEGFCEGAKEIEIPVFDSLPPETYFEVEKGKERVGILIEGQEVNFPKVSIEDVVVKLKGGVILFKFKRIGDLGKCELKLYGKDLTIFIDKIPLWRNYLKIKDLINVSFEQEFEDGISYSLKCFSKDGKAYILVEPFESISVF